MQLLNKQEIHQLAMQEVGNFLEENGYEFLAVNSKEIDHHNLYVLKINCCSL